MAHYLVTGCAGFIASRVAELLVEAGHTVCGIDNLNDAYDRRLKHWRLDRLKLRPEFTFIEADIADNRLLSPIWAAMPKPEAVFNLAARAGVRQSVENPSLYYDTNVTGTLNLLELARQTGVSRFLLASTSSLYGSHNQMPYSEDSDTGRPLSPYAASKKAAEALCYSYHHMHGMDVAIPRYFTVYGPAGRPDMSAFRFVQWVSEGQPVTVYGDGPLAQYRITNQPVTDVASENAADDTLRRALDLAMIERGVFINPMLTKIYVSLAHQPADIDRYVDALHDALRASTNGIDHH